MLYAIRQIFLKGGDIKDAINYIFKTTGKMPTKSEGMKIIKMYQDIQKDTAKIFQFPKDRITDPFKPRPGDPKYVDSVIKDLKSRDPLDAMKEANLIIGRKNPSYKGPYKNLSDDEAQRILKETDDHIFQRDIKGEFEPEFASGGIAEPLHLYDGGRANYDKGGMSRRKFLQLFGGLASVPLLGKYFKWAKPAAKAVSPAAEVVTRGADGIPNYVWDLINVVKAKGTKEIVENFHHPKFKYDKVYNYKGVEVAEDAGGNIKIKSDKSGVATDASTGKTHEGIAQENHIQIDRGQMGVKDEGLETQKAFQEPDEYFEGTVYPDMDGKMKDVVDGLDNEVHEYFKSIADESLIKKASGGRVDLSKGGLAHVLGV